jgi:NADH-quinone oxidoreductase subunit N
MLLSISGIFLVASANDMICLFLGIELASIPTYIMVSISRPIPAAQEAGVKYFFLGAMAAALMLFGLSYLYGTTGTITLDAIGAKLRGTTPLTSATTLDAGKRSAW